MTWLAPQEERITSGQLLFLQHLGSLCQEEIFFLPSGRKEFRIWGSIEGKVRSVGKGHIKHLIDITFVLLNH